MIIVGTARDELRKTENRSVKAEEVAQKLSKVRWSAGREVGEEVCEKLIVLYDKFAGSAPIKNAVMAAQDKLRRLSPFDDYSKRSA